MLSSGSRITPVKPPQQTHNYAPSFPITFLSVPCYHSLVYPNLTDPFQRYSVKALQPLTSASQPHAKTVHDRLLFIKNKSKRSLPCIME